MSRLSDASVGTTETKHMRALWTLFSASLFCYALLGADFRQLSRVHTVYIMAMTNGLDQFIANRFTNSGVIWVVLDPARADAILTERLDEDFWKWLNSRYPLASKAPLPAGGNDFRHKGEMGPNGAVRGTVFLVDPRTRLVLWSYYAKARKASADELDQVALRITKSLTSNFRKK